MSLSSLELVKISKQISDISELGLYLKFKQIEVDAFEKENDKDLTIKKGTRDMLKIWYQKDGSTKDKLVKALRLSEMGKLADRVEQGILPDEHKRFLELDVKSPITVSTIPQASRESGSFDDILKTVARKVVKNDEIDNLGSALGFEPADRQRYIATNSRYHSISYSGTLDMLRDWQKRQTQSTESVALKTALRASGNIHLADEIFGEGQPTSGETVSAAPRPLSSASGGILPQGALSADDEVSTSKIRDKHVDLFGISEETLSSLAESLGNHTNLQKLAFKLGFPNAKWQQYKASNTRRDGRVSSEGTFDMLIDWKMKTLKTSQIPLLKEALIDAGFVEFAEEYLLCTNLGRLKLEGSGETPCESLVSSRPSDPSTSASVGIPLVGAEDRTASASKISDAVSDKKLNTLATHVPHGKYSELSNNLGIGYNEASAILVKHGNDSKAAIRECLGIWKDRTGGSMAKLKEILGNAEVGGLMQHLE